MAGVMWRELTRRMLKKQLAAGVHKTEDNQISIRLEWQKIVFVSGLGGYRRTPPASSRPLDHGST